MALITQLQLQIGLKTGLDTVSGFNSAAQIEGDELLDGPTSELPYALILTASEYELTPIAGGVAGTYTIPVVMFFEFVDWQTTRNEIRNLETSVIEMFNTDGDMWSANGLASVSLNSIRAGDIGGVYPIGSGEDALPVFLTRTMDFELELY
jgi:hypothetical protein